MKEFFKKIEILVHHRDKSMIVNGLQDLGVVHLELNDDYRNEPIDALEAKKSLLIKASEIIGKHKGVKNKPEDIKSANKLAIDEIASQILAINEQSEQDKQQLESLKKTKWKYELLGEFDEDKLYKIKQSGVHLAIYTSDRKQYSQYNFENLVCEPISETKDKIYFAVLSSTESVELPFEAIQLPKKSLVEVSAEENEIKDRQQHVSETLDSYVPYLNKIADEIELLDNQVKLLKADGSFLAYGDGAILYLSGWYPQTEKIKIEEFIAHKNLSFKLSEPTVRDNVPVLLNNLKYPKLFESITGIFQLPSYYEMDLTPFIAVFYPILFAYCLGDAGYGLILLLASVIGWFTFLNQSKNMAVLGVILGSFTTLMGLVKSGSIFGMPIITEEPNAFFAYLSQFVLIPDDRGVVFNAFNVALMIGVVQILVGIIISIVNKIRYQSWLASLSQIGKLFIVVSLIWMFLADMQHVMALQPLGQLRVILLIMGVALVMFFHDLSVSITKRPFTGILPLFFIATGILGDVLSYVRLFALGVASSVLGLVVNQIGMQIMEGAWWQLILGILFLLIGHSLNLALATLGAFVHPLRLTFVEFYNNAQFEGGGRAYKPFKKSNVSS